MTCLPLNLHGGSISTVVRLSPRFVIPAVYEDRYA
jgi:hypothetical protein